MRFLIPVLLAIMLFSGCVQLPGMPGKASSPSSPAVSGAGNNASGASSGPAGATAGTEPSGQQSGGQQSGTGAGTQPSGGESQAGSQSSSQGSAGGEATGSQATSLESQEISYLSGAWKIYGTAYDSSSDAPTKCIVLLHGLGGARDSYPISFVETLHNQFPDAVVVAIDMRGHGKSTNLGTYDQFDTAAYKDMKTDVVNLNPAMDKIYPNIKEYYVVGASMGSTAALYAATQDKEITRLVMLSPGMEYQDVGISRQLETYVHDILAVAASGDSYSDDSADEILSIRGSVHTKVKKFSGSAHGTELFAATESESPSLETAIVQFLK
jgi:pimeloyl-ACP methyl ester carboxylesterase